jgi:hypothetical protein
MISYSGMSYEQASREASRILKIAAASGNWHHIVEKLSQLKAIMERNHAC